MAGQPFDDRDGWVWFNGEFVPHREAKVHVLSHALHYASCVFEGERCYDGVIFKSREHSERLIQSAKLLGFEVGYTAEQLDKVKADLVKKQGWTDCYVRAFAWRGSDEMGVSAQNGRISVAVTAWPWGDYFADKMKGIRLMVAPWRRPAPDTAPSNSKAAGLYMICTLSKHAAEAKGYADAMMFDWRGHVAEATGANIFFVKDGKIHTPDPDCFLNGITRQTVIDLAKRRGFEVIERVILPEELEGFEQCFLTGTAAEVTPVSEIGPYSFEVGAIAKTLMEDYSAEVQPKQAIAAE
jgi:branched-chain amino acid aminotransferase